MQEESRYCDISEPGYHCHCCNIVFGSSAETDYSYGLRGCPVCGKYCGWHYPKEQVFNNFGYIAAC